MSDIDRILEKQIISTFDDNKICILYGPRQTGKTTLSKKVMGLYKKSLYLTSDDNHVRNAMENTNLSMLETYFGVQDLIVIDEAQRITNIGITLKLFHDHHPDVKILATGSSSFDLANKINEPLTGRKKELLLLPFSITEISKNNSELIAKNEEFMLYGGYPEIVGLDSSKKIEYLKELANSYTYKDIFSPEVIYDQTVIFNLLRLLAYQIGQEVSYNELSKTLGVSQPTIVRYIDLLEKCFLVFRLNQYKRNQRREVGKLRKVYFYDLGLRNALINNFNSLDFRQDKGALWENHCILEKIKLNYNKESFYFYWRSKKNSEIDLIEEKADDIYAFEFKSGKKKTTIPKQFELEYANYKSYKVITDTNFLEYIALE